ncbi:MAG TPA: DUF2637 domain-containing protein [Kribbella sp.]|jgi:hypothetical protein
MTTRTAERDLWAVSGMAIAATSAAVASFSGLRGLASVAGWPEHLSWLLPVTVDAYAMTSTRLWLAGRTRRRGARPFAAANAFGAIAGSVAGNAVYHAVSTGLIAVSWPIVVSVGAVPAAVLGLIAHLHALHSGPAPPDVSASDRGPTFEPGNEDGSRTDDDGTERWPQDRPHSASPPRTHRPPRKRPRYRTEADLMNAARAADRRHKEKYGRPITRDALRIALKISGPRATELRRHLAGNSPAVRPLDAKEVANHP